MHTKAQYRSLIRNKRNELSQDDKQVYEKRILQYLHPFLKGKIASYQAFGSEVDITTLQEVYDIYYPTIDGDDMMFFKFEENSEMKKHPFGMNEIKDGIREETFDVILVPLIAYDIDGNRLGQGKGYYDRFLKNTNALTIGIAFSLQEVLKLPVEEHDIKLDMIVNENGIAYKCREKVEDLKKLSA